MIPLIVMTMMLMVIVMVLVVLMMLVMLVALFVVESLALLSLGSTKSFPRALADYTGHVAVHGIGKVIANA